MIRKGRRWIVASIAPILVACSDPDDAAPRPSTVGSLPPAELEAGADASLGGRGGPLDAGQTLRGSESGLSGAALELGARMTETEIIVELPSDVLFEFDQSEIQPAAAPTLRSLATLISENDSGLVTINGHTDSVGSDDYNQSLSERRAAAVASWLTEIGEIRSDRLRTAGFGSGRPVAPNQHPDGSDDPDGRQRNRRVEVILPRH
jgi:photosystem I P700 chlorophyll a apoprotein A2